MWRMRRCDRRCAGSGSAGVLTRLSNIQMEPSRQPSRVFDRGLARVSFGALDGMTLSVRKVILNDYPSSLAWMLIASLWLLGVPLPENRRLLAQTPGFVVFPIVATLSLFAVLVWRVRRMSRLSRSGRQTPALITGVWVACRGPITFGFSFEHEGRRIRARMHVARWKRVPALKRGQSVEALYDPAHPTRAVISNLLRAYENARC